MQGHLRVAVVGATGMVGQSLLSILAQRKFPLKSLAVIASERSKGQTLRFGQQDLKVEALETFDFKGIDIAFFSAGGEISKHFVPKATQAGCLVIDNTSTFRYEPDVPLMVPEVNPEVLSQWTNRRIIANPNCSTIQLVCALAPLHRVAHLERVEVATYQSASGAGAKAVDELLHPKHPAQAFVLPLAYNLIPQIDVFLDNGYTKEEMKIIWETRKILQEPALAINATAVRVPVEVGHSEVVSIKTRHALTAQQARDILSQAPGVVVKDHREPRGYPTPKEVAGLDPVFVGRIREDLSQENGLNLWIVADNIRKGAALNSVQIAEAWYKAEKL